MISERYLAPNVSPTYSTTLKDCRCRHEGVYWSRRADVAAGSLRMETQVLRKTGAATTSAFMSHAIYGRI